MDDAPSLFQTPIAEPVTAADQRECTERDRRVLLTLPVAVDVTMPQPCRQDTTSWLM